MAEMMEESARIAALRDRLLANLAAEIPGLAQTTVTPRHIPGNLSLRFPGIRAPELIAAAPGLCVSTGSACTSAEIAPSHVLRAMGLTDAQAAATLRVGIGRFTSAADIETATSRLVAAYRQVAATMPQPVEA
jgi:cysteine desulfurase